MYVEKEREREKETCRSLAIWFWPPKRRLLALLSPLSFQNLDLDPSITSPTPTPKPHQVCTGAKSEDAARLACRKYAKIIQKLGFPASFKDFKVQNIVGSADVRFPIRLEGLAYAHGFFCSYEPELFPGLIYRMKSPKVVLLIFVSGKVVLTGAKAREDVYQAFDAIYPVLQEFRKADAAPHPASAAAVAAANAGSANGGEGGSAAQQHPALGAPAARARPAT